MTERAIFRNIQHVPKVWGVTYHRLFAALGGGLLITTVGFALSSGASALGKISIIGLGIGLTLSFYGICFCMERNDAIDRDLPFLKNTLNVQSMSQQTIQIQGGRNALQ